MEDSSAGNIFHAGSIYCDICSVPETMELSCGDRGSTCRRMYVWNHLKDGKQKKKGKMREEKEQGNTLKAAYESRRADLQKYRSLIMRRKSSMRT